MAAEIAFVLGTRPEIIKLAPVIRCCERTGVEYTLCHTGQHYSTQLDEVFFEQLNLPNPDYNLQVGSGSHGSQTAEMLTGIEHCLRTESPEVTIVQGDTNSVLAGAIAASKLETRLGHVEAGLRSFDRSMPEEINRIIADHVADELYAPTERAKEQLEREGVNPDRIHHTGNTVVDAVEQHRPLAKERSSVHEDLEIEPGEYAVLTVHRAENVDAADRLERILRGVARSAQLLGNDVVYPIHPRAMDVIDSHDLVVPERIQLVEPLDYLDFLALEDRAALAFTDSGGVQEEVCILGTPCVTVRENTERPETIEVGANELAGTDPDTILKAARKMARRTGDWDNPFGDGTAGEQVLAATLDERAPVEVTQ